MSRRNEVALNHILWICISRAHPPWLRMSTRILLIIFQWNIIGNARENLIQLYSRRWESCKKIYKPRSAPLVPNGISAIRRSLSQPRQIRLMEFGMLNHFRPHSIGPGVRGKCFLFHLIMLAEVWGTCTFAGNKSRWLSSVRKLLLHYDVAYLRVVSIRCDMRDQLYNVFIQIQYESRSVATTLAISSLRPCYFACTYVKSSNLGKFTRSCIIRENEDETRTFSNFIVSRSIYHPATYISDFYCSQTCFRRL